ncbi:MAG: lactonase family protein [Lapillicoccus sp.]
MRLVLGGYGSAIGVVDLSELDGSRFGEPRSAAEAASPSWVLPSADGRFVYAALESAEGRVGAWAVTAELPWRPLGTRSTGGADPCHLALSPDGGWLLAANYSSGSVSVHPVREDGSLGERVELVAPEGETGPVADRQDRPHAHQVVFAPDGKVLVCDLGLDLVHADALDPVSGRLTQIARSPFPPGTGPRHLVLTRDGRTAYVVGELSSTLSVCRVTGPRLEVLQTVSARAADADTENTAAEVALADDERTVLVSQRGDDTVATLSVDARTARLVSVDPCGGSWPRWAGLVGGSAIVADERSDAVVVLRRQGYGWAVEATTTWTRPTCVAPLPTQ